MVTQIPERHQAAGVGRKQSAGSPNLLPSLWLLRLSPPTLQVYEGPTLLKKVSVDNLAWLHRKHTTRYPGSSFSNTDPVLTVQ